MKGDLDRALRDCLAGMDSGETEAACLARYPQHATELAPMLAVAGQLRGLRGSELTAPARVRAKATLHRAVALRAPKPISRWLPWGKPARALAGLAVAALLVVLSARMVAATRPGDLAYPLRVEIERVPAWMAPAGPERTAAELALAARRLDDLQMGVGSGRGADGAALDALCEADSAAAEQAAEGDASLRDMVARRIRSQARVLEGMAAASPDLEGTGRLRLAAQRARALADGLVGADSPHGDPGSQSEGPVAGETRAPAATATHLPQLSPSLYPSSRPVATQTRAAERGASSTPDSQGKSWQTPGPHGTPDPTAAPAYGATAAPAGNGQRSPTAVPSPGPPSSQTPAPAPTNLPGGPQFTPVPGPVRTPAPGPQPTSSGPGGPGAPPTSYPGGGRGGSSNGAAGTGTAASPTAGSGARGTP